MNGRKEVLRYFEMHKDYMDSRVSDGIEKYRKGNFKIKVVYANGNPVNAKITAELKTILLTSGQIYLCLIRSAIGQKLTRKSTEIFLF